MVPNEFIRKSAMRFRLSLVSTFLSYFRFHQFFGNKTGSSGRGHMVPNMFIRKSPMGFRLSLVSTILRNFQFSTGFSPIKPEVDIFRV